MIETARLAPVETAMRSKRTVRFVLEIEEPTPRNMTRTAAMAHGGWTAEAFDELLRTGRLVGSPDGRDGEPIYSRETIETVALQDMGMLPRPRPDPRFASRHHCYFVGGDEGPIKIGFSQWPARRLKQMQGHSPVPLRILASITGGAEREQHYHRRFSAARLRGEWFERTPEIIDEIDRINREEAPTPFRHGC